MKAGKKLTTIRQRRAQRVRARVRGTAERPRLSIFRSNRYVNAQLIDDTARKTLAAVFSRTLLKGEKITKTQSASRVGAAIAEIAKKAGITKAVVDRGRYQYHGRVRALVEAARVAGLQI